MIRIKKVFSNFMAMPLLLKLFIFIAGVWLVITPIPLFLQGTQFYIGDEAVSPSKFWAEAGAGIVISWFFFLLTGAGILFRQNWSRTVLFFSVFALYGKYIMDYLYSLLRVTPKVAFSEGPVTIAFITIGLAFWYLFKKRSVKAYFAYLEGYSESTELITPKGKRPKGVTILGWLCIFPGVIGSLISAFTLKTDLAAHGELYFKLPNHYYYVVQSANAIGGITHLIAAVGLLKLLRWARAYFIILTLLWFLYGVAFYFIYTSRYTIPHFIQSGHLLMAAYMRWVPIMGLLWSALIFWYFNRPRVIKCFQGSA